MIYLIIADEQNIKRDCHDMWQPHNLLPKKIFEYVEKTKNKTVKFERSLAYSTLFCSLKEFYSIENPVIARNHNGKPYLENTEVYISLSHCDMTAVVSLSDEGEIGVDIQSFIDDDKAKHLNERFLSEVLVKQKKINIQYYSIIFTDTGYKFDKIFPTEDMKTDFLSKWVYAESVIKTFGLNFSDISKNNELSEATLTEIVKYKNFKIATTIAK